MHVKKILAMMAALSLTACGDKQPTAAPPSPYQPVASIQEIMQAVVDPSADALWDAVSTTVTTAGEEKKQPRTAQEWIEVRHLAIRLVEASNLLVVDGRVVAHSGKQLEDSHIQGILSAPDIQKKIDADRGAFIRRAQALQQAAIQSLAAIDAKNVDQLIEAGGKLDQACESCHKQYWYPNDKVPTK